MNPWLLRAQKIIFLFFASSFIFIFFYFSKIDSINLYLDFSADTVVYTKVEKKVKQYLSRYKGQKTWNLSLKKINQDLQKIYDSGYWHVRRQFPNRIIVILNQEDPIALFFKNKDEFYPVFLNGSIGPRLDFKKNLNFPIVRGVFFQKEIQLRKEITYLLVQLPKKGWMTLNNISEIKYQKKNESFLFFLVSHNFVIESNKAIDKIQIQKINFVLNYLIHQKLFNRHIDSRFEKKIIVNTMK